MKLKDRLNYEADVESLVTAIADNDGHCPCQWPKTDDTKCKCRDFREQKEPGPCHCGLYIKVVEE